MFLGWTHHLAADLRIRRYAFFPSGAFAVSFINALWREMPRRRNPSDDAEPIQLPGSPNFPIFPWWQLSPVFRSYTEGDPNSEFIRDLMLCNQASHGLIFNTFRGLEGPHLDYLANNLGHNRIWPVGPVLQPGPVDRGGSSSISPDEIHTWLDSFGDNTVVYICFGSQAVLTNDQMRELTRGLEKSGVKFILSVKSPTRGHANGGEDLGSIPSGFEARTAGRGMLIKGWAPQVTILRHRAVGVFLTHCGWNSALESIAAGVPMLTWPMGADQYLNAKLLVEELGVAVRAWEGAETVPDSDDVARFLVEATGEEWGERRARAAELGERARDAVREGGESFESLENLVRDLARGVLNGS
ncbi:UDP-glycosyltransferase 1 [Striga asiatica]|uniref:UDP-glycosyltransferase 1 n=1 Tax=Striga asiatica TaxID=4170 RepID=A0A5A7PW50_STRAF|nr:UDP-glycosyltransferase 1 [Striga asiatica]